MAKKPAAKKPGPKADQSQPRRRENIVQRVAEEVEARFLEGAEMATETTSAETNIALAALAAIEGPRDSPTEVKPAHGKRKTARPKKR
jgi:acyl-CoA reductase-like NAD-dependent aldehyde dehydrogenase